MSKVWLVGSLGLLSGCGNPHSFRKIQSPEPLVRARAVGVGDGRPDAVVVPALVGRLEDPDPVVRLAAHQELRQRTGRDFGFVPWASPEERARAVARWRYWLSGADGPSPTLQSASVAPTPIRTLPADSNRPLNP